MLEYNSDHDDNNQRPVRLTRKVVTLDDNWTMKSTKNGNRQQQQQQQLKSSNQGEAVFLDNESDATTFDQQQQMKSPEKAQTVDDIHIFSPDEFDTDIQPIPKPTRIQLSSLSPTRTKINRNQSSRHIETRKPISKIPVRSHTFSDTRSFSPNQRINRGAFHFVTTNDQHDDRSRLISTDEDDSETNDLKEDDLKVKLKEHKRHRKHTGEILNKLHENYEELLEKYAQAENTIDQLRFQPKFDNTPKSTTSEYSIQFAQQSTVNKATLRSSGVYHSTAGSPLSEIRPVHSSTTTTTTPAKKSISPTNSGTIESVYLDEILREKVSSTETVKLDLLIQIETLSNKMKTFLTLMDANQLTLNEQKQVYETVKQDYEKLLRLFEQNKVNLDHDPDINKELEVMRQLLDEIVKRITNNLLGKSSTDQQTPEQNRSSRLSTRSSVCNHTDLMEQYKKLLNVVNTNRKGPMNEYEQIKSNINNNHKQKPYVYVSGDSDDDEEEENEGIKPIPYTKGIASTSFELDYIPSTSVKQQQHKIEDQTQNFQLKRKLKINPPRYSTSRTDSGIGTKMSHDSKLYPSTMDGSHFQSLDDEQESISSSSSRSSGTGSESPGSPNRNKFDNRTLYRKKPTGHSNLYQNNIETDRTGPFDPQTTTSAAYKKQMQRSYHIWKPEQTSVPHRSRLIPIYRSTSVTNPLIEDYKSRSHRLLTTPQILSKTNSNYRQIAPPSYRSSLYIAQTNTNNELQDHINPNLYLDPQTGIVYRYETSKSSSPTRVYYHSSSPTKLCRCNICGTVTNYHHRHHIEPSTRRITTYADDLGYESDKSRKHRRYRYIDYSATSSSSSSDDDDDGGAYEVMAGYLDLRALNQAYNRAERIQRHSRSLSRLIARQMKLALATL